MTSVPARKKRQAGYRLASRSQAKCSLIIGPKRLYLLRFSL